MPDTVSGNQVRDPVRVVAGRLSKLTGWRRLVVAAVLGALAAGAFAPLYLVPLLWPAFTGLLWLLDGAGRRSSAILVAWAFGAGHFMAGVYWVGISFLVDAERFALLMPFAVVGLSLGLGLFPALAIFATWLSGRRGPARVLVLAAAWLAAEWLRSWILTGFPWNLLGSAWVFSDAMSQLAALTGVWGLSLITILAAAAPATAGEGLHRGTTRRWAFTGTTLLVLALTWFSGHLRLVAAPAAGSDTVPGIALRLVQPSIEQSLKWRSDLRRRHVQDQVDLSTGRGAENITHLVWAETAVPFNLSGESELRRSLAAVVPEGGMLLTGAPRIVRDSGELRIWNSLHALNAAGEIDATYDKSHLVPFGEYMPLKWLFGLSKFTEGRVDFSSGPGPETLVLPGLPPVGVLICYEVIFPGGVTAANRRPAWLLNVTNDAWFGVSSGPYQHLASARLRAIEEGVPLVRVANAGVSAVIDAYGRELARLGLNRTGVIDSPLPRPIIGLTMFARLGNWTVFILVIGALSIAHLISLRARP